MSKKVTMHMKRIAFVTITLLSVLFSGFAQGKYQTRGPGKCATANCHPTENGNMISGHNQSALNVASAPNAPKYASAIGVKDFLKSPLCMSCHGTIVSGKEGKDVEEGVSCESCHGAGSGYTDPHLEGPKCKEAYPRPAYAKAVSLGMVDMKMKPEELAKVCVRCHYTTDQKLIAAGHPDGSDFRYETKMTKVVKHWQCREKGNIPNPRIFANVVASKTPGGKVTSSQGNGRTPDTTRRATGDPPPGPTIELNGDDVRIVTPPVQVNPITDLPAFPNVAPNIRTDSLLLLLKKRLELLYEKTGK
ncbi:MAG: multiheme c-type cytochrome [Bacteroidota bacterium]